MPPLQSIHVDFSESGTWWPGNQPEKAKPGTLTYSSSAGAVLQLIGSFGQTRDWVLREENEHRVIHGKTLKGRFVTLLGCFRQNLDLNFAGMPAEKHFANMVALGCHMDSSDEPVFISSAWSLPSLQVWLGHSPINSEREDAKGFLVRAKSIEEDIVRISDQHVTANTYVSLSFGEGRTELASDDSFLMAEPSSPRSLDWHWDNISKISAFISICVGHYLPKTSLRLFLPAPEGRPAPVAVDIIFTPERPLTEKDRGRRPFIKWANVQGANPAAFADWILVFEKIRPAVSQLLAVIDDARMFIDTKFQFCAQAIEALHRNTVGGSVTDPYTYGRVHALLEEAIPSGTPKVLRDKLRKTLLHANDLSLRQSLKQLIDRLCRDFGHGAPKCFDGNFRGLVVDTRNYYAHGSTFQLPIEHSEMHWPIRRMVLLLMVCLLREVAISPAVIANAIEQSNESRQLWNSTADPT